MPKILQEKLMCLFLGACISAVSTELQMWHFYEKLL